MAGGLWPWPRPGHYSRDLCTPPKKIHGAARGYQEPSGAKQTGQDSPQEQEALLGLNSDAEASSGHERSQGPSQGPSATASTSATGEAGGWDWPPRPRLG